MAAINIEVSKYALSGEVVVGSENEYIASSPLGSCVAVVAYDAKNRVGGIAHIMLPGKSPIENGSAKNKYTNDAIDELLLGLQNLGALKSEIEVCLVGGANVLRKKGDTIAEAVVKSVEENISERNLTVLASSLGGFERRSVAINIQTGITSYTIGDGKGEILCDFNE